MTPIGQPLQDFAESIATPKGGQPTGTSIRAFFHKVFHLESAQATKVEKCPPSVPKEVAGTCPAWIEKSSLQEAAFGSVVARELRSYINPESG
jgi:hypothetical protein